MRAPAKVMALLTLAALALGAWATGCTGLSSDCELNLNCAPTVEPPSCEGPLFYSTCDACMQKNCCAAVGACKDDNFCINACVFGVEPSPPECNSGQIGDRQKAFGACMTGPCMAECVKDLCNPVTNAGCSVEASCDLVYPGMFVCLPFFDPPPAALCAQCDNLTGPFCGPGLRCHPGSSTCARYCCDDTDCGTGRCEFDSMLAIGAPVLVPGDKVGVCVTMDGAGAACDAPAMSPSAGVCAGQFPPN